MDICDPLHIVVAGIISSSASGRLWVGSCVFWQHLDLRATELYSGRTPGWHRHKYTQNTGLWEQIKNANPTLTRGRHHSHLLITSKSPTPPPTHTHPFPQPSASIHALVICLPPGCSSLHLTKTMIGRVDSHSLYGQLNEWLCLSCVCRWRGRSDDFQMMDVEPTEIHVKSKVPRLRRTGSLNVR